jgi:Fic family protein
MRIPEKSPDTVALYEKNKEEFSNFLQVFYQRDRYSEEIREYVSKYNDKRYIHWDDLKRKKIPFKRELFWLLLKVIRNYAAFTTTIGDESFMFVALDKFQRELHLIDKESPAPIDALIGGKPSEASKRQYLANSVMEEAIASSQLEGAATTRQVAKKFLREGKAPRNKSERMILNNYRTIRKLKEIKDLPLSLELITDIHLEITNGTLETREDEIHFRTTDDIVVRDKVDYTKVYHQPPDHKVVLAMLDDLCTFVNDDETFIHPILKAIIIHFLIGYIHPFNDGNGRTARALFYWYVLKNGYDLFEYLSISRIYLHSPAKYAKAYLYTETDENDMTYFIEFNLAIISRAMDELKKYIQETQAEQREAIALVGEIPGMSFRQAEILKDFIGHPDRAYTIGEIAGKYKVSMPTARSDLFTLEKLGKLRKIKDGKRWVFLLSDTWAQ